jgi:hypothetical protein
VSKSKPAKKGRNKARAPKGTGRAGGKPIAMPSRATRHPRAFSDEVPPVDDPCDGCIPMPAKPWPVGEWWPKVKVGADGSVEVVAVPV